MTLHATVAGWLLGAPSGANRRLLDLLAHLGPMLGRGERITVLHRWDYEPPALPGIQWRALAIPAGPTVARVRAERRRLPDVLRELRATVHDHGFLPLPPVAVPTCLVVHDLRGPDGLSVFPRWLARAALRSACSRAGAVVAPSEWTAMRLRALCPAAPPPFVVRNGVTLPGPDPSPPPQPALPASYLLHVGHLEARKNLGVVVDALAALPAPQRPQLWLAGADAGALPELQARAKACAVTVYAFGIVTDKAVASLYRHARAVVVPSLHEGFGLPALEAIAHGKPVLVSSAGALPEVVGSCARVLPPHDVAAWSAAIAAATTSPADVEACRAHAARFSWRAAAADLLSIWRALSG